MKDRTMKVSDIIRTMSQWLNRQTATRPHQHAAHDEAQQDPSSGGARGAMGAADLHAMHHVNRALDRAMELGLLDHAERIVGAVLQSGAVDSPQTIERIARLRLIQSRPDDALHIIETAKEETSSLRMLRIVCCLLVGRRLDAHVDLHRWSWHNTCPLEARCLLALLDAENGRTDDALNELHKNIRQLDDPQSFELMALLAAGRGRHDLAEHWIARLSRVIQSREAPLSPRILAESLRLSIHESIAFTDEDVESLAAELLVTEPVIPALVLAQELELKADMAGLIYRAIELALPEITNRDAALESLARLALALDQRDEATKWLELAVEENRITAIMAKLARDLIGLESADDTLAAKDHHEGDGVIGRVEAEDDAGSHSDRDGGSGETWKRAA